MSNDHNLDGEKMFYYFSCSYCIRCKHFHGKDKGTCNAFPGGIPDEFAKTYFGDDPKKHGGVVPGQVGNFTFEFE